MTISREDLYKLAVKYVIDELKEHTKLPAVILQHRLREDYGLDLTAKELSAAVRKFGKRKIKYRNLEDAEMNFGFIYTSRDTKMYELR